MTVFDASVLDVQLYGESIGTLTLVPGDRSVFAFNESYIVDENGPTLGLGFFDQHRQLLTDFRVYGPALMPFFSNLLPEDQLREYLAKQAGVKPEREFFLLQALGADLPGAVTARPKLDKGAQTVTTVDINNAKNNTRTNNALRFSLAGVQLKFSAIAQSTGGLTIPAHGIGGAWIVKLPSTKFDGVPENEFSMMTLARLIGMDVPAVDLVSLGSIENLPKDLGTLQGNAFVIERFDRLDDGTAVHVEDFAQVFNVYPKDKYSKASYANIAAVIAAESSTSDIAEFIRRLVFNSLIGNADMHLKNWSIRYIDKKNATLAPAYDFLSTTAYISDEKAALNFSRTKRFNELTFNELSHLANKARMPEALVIDTAKETVELFHQQWNREKGRLPFYKNVIDAVERQLDAVPIA